MYAQILRSGTLALESEVRDDALQYFEFDISDLPPVPEEDKNYHLTANFEDYTFSWVEDVELPIPKTLEDLEKENNLLKAQIQAQSDRTEFIEDCIAEMAMEVYSV